MWEMCCSYSASPLGGHYKINDHRSDVTPTKVGRTYTQSLFFFHVLFFSVIHLSIGSPNQSVMCEKMSVCVFQLVLCWVWTWLCLVSGDVTPTAPWHVFCVCDACVQDHACAKAMCCKQCAEPGQAEVGRGGEDVPWGVQEEEEGCGAGRWLENGKGRDFTYQISVAGYRAGRWSSAAAPGWFLPHAWNVCWDLMRRWRFSGFYSVIQPSTKCRHQGSENQLQGDIPPAAPPLRCSRIKEVKHLWVVARRCRPCGWTSGTSHKCNRQNALQVNNSCDWNIVIFVINTS